MRAVEMGAAEMRFAVEMDPPNKVREKSKQAKRSRIAKPQSCQSINQASKPPICGETVEELLSWAIGQFNW